MKKKKLYNKYKDEIDGINDVCDDISCIDDEENYFNIDIDDDEPDELNFSHDYY